MRLYLARQWQIYTPETVADQKIKKKEDRFAIDLVKTVDIAAACGAKKEKRSILGRVCT